MKQRKFIVKFIVVSCQTSIKFNISCNATHWRSIYNSSVESGCKIGNRGNSMFKLTVHFHLRYLHFKWNEWEKIILGAFSFAIYCQIWYVSIVESSNGFHKWDTVGYNVLYNMKLVRHFVLANFFDSLWADFCSKIVPTKIRLNFFLSMMPWSRFWL